jgi:hypothetical protein
MDQLLQLIGLALPDTPAIFRLKVLFAGICALAAGLLFATSGLPGSVLWGGLIVACGFAVIAITLRSHVRAARKLAAERIALQERQEKDAREHQERLLRQQSCAHSWIEDDTAADYDVYQMRCTQCGAVREGWS